MAFPLMGALIGWGIYSDQGGRYFTLYSDDMCLIYNKEYLCYRYCSCKWQNDTRDCLGRASNDLDLLSKECNDLLSDKIAFRKEEKLNSFITAMVFSSLTICVIIINRIIVYKSDLCPSKMTNLPT
jgi:hypothetical protein